MSSDHADKALHLPDLTIQGFCGIRDLTINRLGRVTLIAGMNGAGKTTVLDAVRVFADRGSSREIFAALLSRRDELREYQDEDDETVSGINWDALFWERKLDRGSTISIGPTEVSDRVDLSIRDPREGEFNIVDVRPGEMSNENLWVLCSRYHLTERAILLRPRRHGVRIGRVAAPSSADRLTHSTFGPGLLTNRRALTLWAAMALTDAEERAVEALNMVYGGYGAIERIALVGGERNVEPRAIVRIAGEEEPVPLRSLGGGAVRMFGLALALANSRGGFLLIDEVENGLHHTVQQRLWEMVLRTASENNVQVLATTHSWDAVIGFARAAAGIKGTAGALVRLERDGDDTYAIEFSETELTKVAERAKATEHVEVR